jgi:hypothetical protein
MTDPAKKTVKRYTIVLALGIATGLGLATAADDIGQAYADDAAPMLVDAAPAPDAQMTVAKDPSLPALPMPGDDRFGFAVSSYKWLSSGNGWYALVPILILLSWLAMHPKTWPLSKIAVFQKFIESRRGKVAVVAGVALFGLLAHALAATGAPPDLATLKPMGLQVLAAMGGYEGIRILIWG